MTIEEVVKRHVLKMLKTFKHDKRQTAKELGIGLKTLYNWLHKWEVS